METGRECFARFARNEPSEAAENNRKHGTLDEGRRMAVRLSFVFRLSPNGLPMKHTLNVTVCELRSNTGDFADDWDALVDHVQTKQSDLVLLPEMGLAP